MKLFESGTIGRGDIANRIVMAPLGRGRNSEPSREAQQRSVIYYTQRATAGLIISEATHVSVSSVSRPGTGAIHSEGQTAAWEKVTASVHDAGGKIFQQLFHLGRKADPERLPGKATPVAPSPIAAIGELPTAAGSKPFPIPRELGIEEIPGLSNNSVTRRQIPERQVSTASKSMRPMAFWLINSFVTIPIDAAIFMADRLKIGRGSYWRSSMPSFRSSGPTE